MAAATCGGEAGGGPRAPPGASGVKAMALASSFLQIKRQCNILEERNLWLSRVVGACMLNEVLARVIHDKASKLQILESWRNVVQRSRAERRAGPPASPAGGLRGSEAVDSSLNTPQNARDGIRQLIRGLIALEGSLPEAEMRSPAAEAAAVSDNPQEHSPQACAGTPPGGLGAPSPRRPSPASPRPVPDVEDSTALLPAQAPPRSARPWTPAPAATAPQLRGAAAPLPGGQPGAGSPGAQPAEGSWAGVADALAARPPALLRASEAAPRPPSPEKGAPPGAGWQWRGLATPLQTSRSLASRPFSQLVQEVPTPAARPRGWPAPAETQASVQTLPPGYFLTTFGSDKSSQVTLAPGPTSQDMWQNLHCEAMALAEDANTSQGNSDRCSGETRSQSRRRRCLC